MVLSMKQRWMHFYFLNEMVLLVLFAYFLQCELVPGSSTAVHVMAAMILWTAAYVACFLVMIPVLWARSMSRRRRMKSWETLRTLHQPPNFVESRFKSRDGVQLKIWQSEVKAFTKKRKKVVLLCAPLGVNGPSVFKPMMMALGCEEYVYLSWDYRGFFDSVQNEKQIRQLSVPEHARDGHELLQHCGYQKADIVVGHSMGTIVALELSLLFPAAVGSMIIMNGFHGHVFSTAFQPVCRLPFAGDAVQGLLELLLRNTWLLDHLRTFIPAVMKIVFPIYARIFHSPSLRHSLGDTYFVEFLDSYFLKLCSDTRTAHNYILMFQELNSHSVYHLLPHISQPVLLISGYLDCFTPPMQSVEMARRLPNAVHFCDPFSTHCTPLENPEGTVSEIIDFVGEHLLRTPSGLTETDKRK